MAIELRKLENELITTAALRQYKFLIIYCLQGTVALKIDGLTYTLSATKLITITPKQYYHFSELKNVAGFILKFTYDFFCKDDTAIELIYHNGLYCHFGLNEVINIPDAAAVAKTELLLRETENELENKRYGYEGCLHAILKLLLTEASRYKIMQQGKPLYTPDALFLKFLNLVRDTFTQKLSVKEYADRLNLTEARLNELTRKNTGETTQQLINDLIILEAKRLMNYENLNIKQIASELGFDDPYYFSRFFKKQTSVRPRDQLRKNLSPY